jgi:hypothetical protein
MGSSDPVDGFLTETIFKDITLVHRDTPQQFDLLIGSHRTSPYIPAMMPADLSLILRPDDLYAHA